MAWYKEKIIISYNNEDIYSFDWVYPVYSKSEYDSFAKEYYKIYTDDNTLFINYLNLSPNNYYLTKAGETFKNQFTKYTTLPMLIPPSYKTGVGDILSGMKLFYKDIVNIYDYFDPFFSTTSTSLRETKTFSARNTKGTSVDFTITKEFYESAIGLNSPQLPSITSGSSTSVLWFAKTAAFHYYLADDGTVVFNKRTNNSPYYPGGYAGQRPFFFSPETIGVYPQTSVATTPSGLVSLLTVDTAIDPSNPYSPGGDSGGGGGTGDFDNTGENIPVPSVPSVSASDAGFCTLYSPTITQIKNLASYMWSNAFSLDSFRKIFADPMDCILGLSIFPVTPNVSATREITVGNISTGISANVVANQYYTFDCGTLNINEYWGSFMDYSPYTKVYIYLPYVGIRPLDADDVMGKSVHLYYKIDLLSGACACILEVNNSVLYQFLCSVSSQVPVTSVSYNSMYQSIVNIASSIALGIAVPAGGSSVPALQGQTLSAIPYADINMNESSLVRNVMSAKPSIGKSGGSGGSAGMLGVQTPYLILQRPRQCVATSQNYYMGYPSYQTKKLGDLSGFTVVQDVHLHDLKATQEERDEIYTLLKKGVIL